MGMSIDEAINGVEKRILPIFDNDADHEALVTAIEIMRKYQQIEQIYQQWNEVNDFSYNQAMQKIGEVVEDGKID